MKNSQKLFTLSLSLLLSLFTFNSAAFSQTKTLPKGLDKDSTFEEIVDWLNKTSFPKATIGIESKGSQSTFPQETPDSGTTYYEKAFFTPGFSLEQNGSCERIDLINENMDLASYSTGYPDPKQASLSDFVMVDDDQKKFSGEIRIPLNELSYKGGKKARKKNKKNKAPFWYSTFKLRTELFGMFKTIGLIFDRDKAIKSVEDRMENGMQIRVNGSDTDGSDETIYGSKLIFRFDDKSTSEQFDSAFRQLIRICKKDNK